MDLDRANTVAEPANLSELVDYQAGGVVSRTLISKEAGTVTLFAFDQDQGLSEHTAPYDAMLIVLEGRMSAKIAGKDFVLDKGQVIIMPANKPHALKAITRFKMILTMIRAK